MVTAKVVTVTDYLMINFVGHIDDDDECFAAVCV